MRHRLSNADGFRRFSHDAGVSAADAGVSTADPGVAARRQRSPLILEASSRRPAINATTPATTIPILTKRWRNTSTGEFHGVANKKRSTIHILIGALRIFHFSSVIRSTFSGQRVGALYSRWEREAEGSDCSGSTRTATTAGEGDPMQTGTMA